MESQDDFQVLQSIFRKPQNLKTTSQNPRIGPSFKSTHSHLNTMHLPAPILLSLSLPSRLTQACSGCLTNDKSASGPAADTGKLLSGPPGLLCTAYQAKPTPRTSTQANTAKLAPSSTNRTTTPLITSMLELVRHPLGARLHGRYGQRRQGSI